MKMNECIFYNPERVSDTRINSTTVKLNSHARQTWSQQLFYSIIEFHKISFHIFQSIPTHTHTESSLQCPL